jgi:hypothetical protein
VSGRSRRHAIQRPGTGHHVLNALLDSLAGTAKVESMNAA